MNTCDCAGGHALLCGVHAEEAERLMIELAEQRETDERESTGDQA